MDDRVFDFEKYAARLHALEDARHRENEKNLEHAHEIAEGLFASLRRYVIKHGYKCSVLREGDRVTLLRDESTSFAVVVQDDLCFSTDMHDDRHDMQSRPGLMNRSELSHDQVMADITRWYDALPR